MAELNISQTSHTDLGITDYSVDPQALDYSEGDEVTVDFPNAAKYFGYYKKYGQLKKAIDTLWIYVAGKGYETDIETKVILDHLTGFGEDTSHSLFWNLGVTSMIQGDAFAEIIRDDDGTLINLKAISPERMRIVYGKNGLIKRYEFTGSNKEVVKFKPNEIFHIVNDRIGDEQRGTSVIECCEWVINAIEEARTDYRKVLHRNVVPLRIIEVDTDDTAKRNTLMTEYKEAITKGEVLVVPKNTVSITSDQITIQDPINWIQALENYFYLAVGIPKVIASPDGLSEGSSKISYLIFEPIYTFRQLLLEADIWNQLYLRLKFNRPASLQDNIQSNEAKNTSQTGFQPKDMAVTGGRE
jgi:hypothetical protein